jgi:argininosuccinate lyase
MKKAAGSGSPPRPIWPTGWCARSACRSAKRITSRAGQWRWPRQKGLGLAKLCSTICARSGRHYRRCSVLSVQNSVKSRTFGGTAPSEVRKQVRYWKKRLEKL